MLLVLVEEKDEVHRVGDVDAPGEVVADVEEPRLLTHNHDHLQISVNTLSIKSLLNPT